jgi:SAM-dependent methyltransferase
MPTGTLHTDPAEVLYRKRRREHWERQAGRFREDRRTGAAYHRRLETVYQFAVSPGQRVLEVGCGNGDLLAALKPRVGVGVDFSPQALQHARLRHPHLQFVQADAHALPFDQCFDVIVLSDLVNDLWDVERALRELAHAAGPETRVILNFYSRVWELPLRAAQSLDLATRVLPQNWLTVQDMDNLLRLADWEPMREWVEILVPVDLPVVGPVANRYLARLWPLNQGALVHFVTARPTPRVDDARYPPVVSVIVPARNEAGNISEIFSRTPEMGAGTELVFVEGHSSDNTYAAIEREIAGHPSRSARVLKQTGRGKGDAVRLGFAEARGEVLMILDADLTVAPEDLPRFYDALVSGKGEFINGVRLVYPMEKQAMRFFNFLGNKFFSLAFTWLLGQAIKDSLCGTKVLRKANYERIAANRAYFGDFDPFGDFDLLFGAARLNLKIVDLPIRYRERTYGETNIQRWSHGALLLRMVIFAARRIKFI